MKRDHSFLNDHRRVSESWCGRLPGNTSSHEVKLTADAEGCAARGETHFSSSHERQSELVPEVELLEGKLRGSLQALVRKEEGRQTGESGRCPCWTGVSVSAHEAGPARSASQSAGRTLPQRAPPRAPATMLCAGGRDGLQLLTQPLLVQFPHILFTVNLTHFSI